MRRFARAEVLLAAVVMTACMEYGAQREEMFTLPSEGVFVLSEGNFMYGNASLAFYNPALQTVENELFARANGIKLGDVAMSMTIHNDRGYIAVDNSGVVFVIDIEAGKLTGLIKNLVSPRHIAILNEHKGYITSLRGSQITVFDPTTLQITGAIETHHTTEQIVITGDRALVTCWSYNNKVLVINTLTDEITDILTTAIQPRWIALDGAGKAWILTDGGYQGSEYGYDNAVLYCIDTQTLAIEKEFRFPLGDSPRGLALSPDGRQLYFINRSVWRMDINATQLPSNEFVTYTNTIYYTIGIAPNGDLYLADAVDYMQSGMVYHYSATGKLIDNFRVGIIPTQFCFK